MYPLKNYSLILLLAALVLHTHAQAPPKVTQEDLPRIPPRSVDKALKSFTHLPGLEIQLLVSEPLINDPVAMTFDANGSMYVVEMRGYSEQANDNLGQIRLVFDRDRDGQYESSMVFYKGLSWPTAIIAYDGGVFVGASPDIYYLKDTTRNGEADVVKKIFTGFGKHNVQGLLNSFRWGLDGRIHGSASSTGGMIKRVGDADHTPVKMRGYDFSFDPVKLDIRPESGGAQHGMSFDNFGRKFVCSNSDHIQMVMYDIHQIPSNSKLPWPGPRLSIATDGPQAEVFRTSPIENWRKIRTNWRVNKIVGGPIEGGGRPAGYFTGSTGICIYRGTAMPESYHNLAFIADVGSNLVHRKQLKPNGVAFSAHRIDAGKEFLTSNDVWFRPVQLKNGPSGGLYLLDMYREVIEHPKSLPQPIKKHLDLTSGRDRGRIWRVVKKGTKVKPVPEYRKLGDRALLDVLGHQDGWHRDTATRLLIEHKAHLLLAESLVNIVRESDNPHKRLHALSLLRVGGKYPEQALTLGLNDAAPEIREFTFTTFKPEEAKTFSPELQGTIIERLSDDQIRVQFQAALHARYINHPQKIPQIAKILKTTQDRWLQLAAMSALDTNESMAILLRLAGDNAFKQSSPGKRIIPQLMKVVGADNPKQIQQLTATVVKQAIATATDDTQPIAQRLSAINDLTVGSAKQVIPTLKQLAKSEHEEIKAAALRVWGNYNDPQLTQYCLANRQGASDRLGQVLDEIIIGRKDRILTMLDAVEKEQFKLEYLSLNAQLQLSQYKDKAIAEKLKMVAPALVNQNRNVVLQRYLPALKKKGNAQAGKVIYQQFCMLCHQAENQGVPLGPSLSAMAARGPEAILVNIIDPNREVNPEFENTIIHTKDGRVLAGIVKSRTPSILTLILPGGVTQQVERTQIKTVQPQGVSLMPVGLENGINPAQMADLIAYIMSLQTKADQ